MKVEALTETAAVINTVTTVETPTGFTPSLARASIPATADPRALLSEGESQFYPNLKSAVARFDCQVLAKVHLPALTKRADESLQPAAALNRALAALRCWEADFAICRGDSLVVVAVVRLRPTDASVCEPERANLEVALDCTLAAARIPVVLIAEASSYDPEHIADLIRPYITWSLLP